MMALHSNQEVTDVLPPPNHDDVQVQVMAIGYMLLFLLGTCGNVAVLTTIYQMVRSRRAQLDNTLIYMVVLSCVDFGVCLSLPFTVIDQILGFWMFGSTMCKLHAVLENFGKILSALIITAMSFDRFAGVCHSHIRWLRSRKLAICILIGMAVYALVALCPLLSNFKAREVILFQKETGPNKVTRMRIEKCTMVEMSAPLFTLFTCFLFVLCYLIPLFLVTFFYTKLLSKLHQHARQFKTTQFRSQIPLMRISLYTLAVACFYFICWTPFWVATAFAVYLEYAGEQNGAVPPVFVYCMYFIHALPFTNSAVNWILYGALNGQLQQRIRHSGGGGGTTNNHAALTTVSVALGRTQPEFLDRTTFLNGSTTIGHTAAHSLSITSGAPATAGSAAQKSATASKALGTHPVNSIPRHSCSLEVKRTCTSPPVDHRQDSLAASTLALLELRRPSCPPNCAVVEEEEERKKRLGAEIGEVHGGGETIRWRRYRGKSNGEAGGGGRKSNGNEEDYDEDEEEDDEDEEVKRNGGGGGDGRRAEGGGQRHQGMLLVHGNRGADRKGKEASWTSAEGTQEFEEDDDDEDGEQALLLHSSDSVDLLLRIESQSTTYL